MCMLNERTNIRSIITLSFNDYNKCDTSRKKMTMTMTKKQEQTEINNIVQDALKDSYHYENMNCYGTHYFWVKTADKFSAIFDEDFNTFVEKVRDTASAYRYHLIVNKFKTYKKEVQLKEIA